MDGLWWNTLFKMDDLGGKTLFSETYIYRYRTIIDIQVWLFYHIYFSIQISLSRMVALSYITKHDYILELYIQANHYNS